MTVRVWICVPGHDRVGIYGHDSVRVWIYDPGHDIVRVWIYVPGHDRV